MQKLPEGKPRPVLCLLDEVAELARTGIAPLNPGDRKRQMGMFEGAQQVGEGRSLHPRDRIHHALIDDEPASPGNERVGLREPLGEGTIAPVTASVDLSR